MMDRLENKQKSNQGEVCKVSIKEQVNEIAVSSIQLEPSKFDDQRRLLFSWSPSATCGTNCQLN